MLSCIAALAALAALLVVPGTSGALPAQDAAQSWYTNGTVWAMVKVGDVVYIGGEFTELVAPNGQTQSRQNLAAISATTGEPLPWAPAADGPVLSMEANTTGSRVFVGGDFAYIGSVNRRRVASLRTADNGSVDLAFQANTGGRVRDMLLEGGHLYLAGEIAMVNGTSRSLVARVDATTGAVDPTFAPSVSGGAVRGIDLSPDGNRLYLAGAFTNINNAATTRYIGAVRTADGSTTAWRADLDQPLFDVLANEGFVYLAVGGTGIPNNRLQKHSAGTGTELYRYIGDGDIQALELHGNLLYIGGHSGSDFGGLERYMVAAIDIRDDHIVDWAPELVTDYGVWAMAVDDDGLWVGGQFTAVNGVPRQGFAHLPEVGGPETVELMDRWSSWRYWDQGTQPAGGTSWAQPSYNAGAWPSGAGELGFGDGDENTVVASDSRTVYFRRSFEITDRSAYDNVLLRYKADAGAAIYLNGQEIVRDNLPTWNLRYADYALSGKYGQAERLWAEHSFPAADLRNGTNTLAVEVHLPWNGHEDMSFAAELVAELSGNQPPPPPTFTCAVTANANGSVTIDWVDLGGSGYDLSQDNAAPIWRVGTSFTDFTPGSSYTVVAWGVPGNLNGSSATCAAPGGPGPFTCSVAAGANGSVDVSWTDLNVGGYDVSQDGGAPVWITSTSLNDPSPGSSYQITAWGDGSQQATCTSPVIAPPFECRVFQANNGAVRVNWDDLGAAQYDLTRSGGQTRRVTGRNWTDPNPVASYTVTPVGLVGPAAGASATCQNPFLGGGFSCTATVNGDGTTTVTWTDLGASGYDVMAGGAAPVWVTDTSWVGPSEPTYQVMAWGLAVDNGRTTTCTP